MGRGEAPPRRRTAMHSSQRRYRADHSQGGLAAALTCPTSNHMDTPGPAAKVPLEQSTGRSRPSGTRHIHTDTPMIEAFALPSHPQSWIVRTDNETYVVPATPHGWNDRQIYRGPAPETIASPVLLELLAGTDVPGIENRAGAAPHALPKKTRHGTPRPEKKQDRHGSADH